MECSILSLFQKSLIHNIDLSLKQLLRIFANSLGSKTEVIFLNFFLSANMF